jgi:membrane associated rhomboid family serine protease
MTDGTPTSAATTAPRITRVVAWFVALVLGAEFLQYTVVQPELLQDALGFRRGDLDLGRWWSAETYLLVHGSVAMALLNAYALLLVGPRLERHWGGKRFAGFLLLAGLGGWMFHLFVGGDAALLGASSAAFGALAAYAMRWGAEEHLLAGGLMVRGRWLAGLMGAMILLLGLRGGPGGGAPFVAHLGGVAVAWMFVRGTEVLLVERFREGVSAVPDDPPEDQPPRAIPKTLPRSRARDRETIDDVVARSNAAAARRDTTPRPRQNVKTPPPQSMAAVPLPDIDMILDKISAGGIDCLTPDERRVLDDHSRRLRGD